MKAKRVLNLHGSNIKEQWLYIHRGEKKADKSYNVYHKVMHVIDFGTNKNNEFFYKIDYVSSLYEPDYWERNGLFQIMENAVMTEAFKKEYDKLVHNYIDNNVYVAHIDIKDDAYYVDDYMDGSATYIIDEKDAKYLIELFKNFDKIPVRKEKINFLTESYPEVYLKGKSLSEEDMQFKFVQKGTQFYEVIYRESNTPLIKTHIFDAPFTVKHKNEDVQTTYDHGICFKMDIKYLGMRQLNFKYFLYLEEAKLNCKCYIEESKAYVEKRLSDLNKEISMLTTFKEKLEKGLKEYAEEK